MTETLTGFQVYLLAAGNGERAGGPKAWREHEGRTLLEKHVEFLATRFDLKNAAISIQDGWQTRCQKISKDIHWVAEDPHLSPLGALQALVKALPLRRWAFFYHVDMPVWEPELFKSLAGRISAAEKAGFEAIAPNRNSRKGHPLLLSPGLGSAILSLDPAKDRLDHWLRTRKEDAVEVPFACIHENWNQRVA